ncbi:MAG: NAD(P)-dependent oxidoreductase [Sulfuritalea sp.]|jgi:3-hydroxyisobutyrate dehydrogenase-like beta-hydroxyacid dehydrogenase|nr:NAD(P)-dependent oxidoreductase [Polynucleobacter sp.]MCF8187496.1 NAD(P)-dependent oxidoreductase [Sulfuritalea sp.]
MTKPVIGFIGVGLMGAGMAKNILTKGYPLVIMGHTNREPVERLKKLGATEATSPKELAAKVDILHLCVTGSPQVEAIMNGPDGIFASGKKGLVVIDCSTSNPVSTMALAESALAHGMTLIDAPLGRTPAEAEAGTLDTMVGADQATFDKVKPILDCWAGNVVHLGPVGLGHKMKLINNFIAMGYAALYSEAIGIARKAGLSKEQFHAVVGSSRMRNGFYDTFMKWTMEGDENAHRFTISNAHKDMRYLSSLANEVGALHPIQAMVKNSFAGMEAAGQAQRYVPMLADFVAIQNGLPPSQSK